MEQYINRLKAKFKNIIYNYICGNKASEAYIQIQDKGNRKKYFIRIEEVSKGK